MDAFASVISNNANNVMKLLTIVTLIISVPTLIASIWGMNTWVPFVNEPIGFWLILAFSAVITFIVGIVTFRFTGSGKIDSNKTVKKVRGRRHGGR